MFARYRTWLSLAVYGVRPELVFGGFAGLDEPVPARFHVNLGVSVLIAAQAALIGFLLVERLKRRRLESEHEKALLALKESDAKNAAILSALPDMMFLLDEDGTYLEWYARDRGNLYVPPEQFLGKNMREIMPPHLVTVFVDTFRRVKESGESASVEYNLVINGNTKFYETRIVTCGDRKFLSVVRDQTEKKQVEQELQQLSSRLLSLQDDERRRLARELHDITAQNLFAIGINLESLRRQAAGFAESSLEMVNECHELCDQSLREVRTLSYALHPPGLDRLGLIPSLQWYIAGFGRRTSMDITFKATLEIDRLPLDLETDIFRIVQEGLNNVARHSGSRTASVNMKKLAGRLVLQIKDKGRGLQMRREDTESGSTFGVGLPSMRERLRRWSGHLQILSERDGVLLLVQVPIPTGVPKYECAVGSKQSRVG